MKDQDILKPIWFCGREVNYETYLLTQVIDGKILSEEENFTYRLKKAYDRVL